MAWPGVGELVPVAADVAPAAVPDAVEPLAAAFDGVEPVPAFDGVEPAPAAPDVVEPAPDVVEPAAELDDAELDDAELDGEVGAEVLALAGADVGGEAGADWVGVGVGLSAGLADCVWLGAGVVVLGQLVPVGVLVVWPCAAWVALVLALTEAGVVAPFVAGGAPVAVTVTVTVGVAVAIAVPPVAGLLLELPADGLVAVLPDVTAGATALAEFA